MFPSFAAALTFVSLQLVGSDIHGFVKSSKSSEYYNECVYCKVVMFAAFVPQGHFRRATVLEKLGRWLEAVAAYLLCLFLGGNDQSLVSTIVCQVSNKRLVPLL